ncbi:MAG: hypothetical protein O9972_39770 [Burkholderiales bacterium]|nr:hypothetical protein [Burkholderiales bacterium]
MTNMEMNVGLAACGPAGSARALFDLLGQGRADLYFARQYARLRRSIGSDREAERRIYDLAAVSAVVAVAADTDGRLDAEKAADMVSFVFERGMNMEISL